MTKRRKLTEQDIARVGRQLTNPDFRLQLRPDFPAVISMVEQPLLPLIEAELAKCGQRLEDIGEINLVCPQKDPDFYVGHRNPALGVFRVAMRKLRAEVKARGIAESKFKIVPQNAICELVHLDRSSGRGVLHSLTRRQVYNVNAKRALREPTAFLSAQQADKPHYFMIVDWHVSQGTTVANLASYLRHNGAHVLGVASLFYSRNLLPDQRKLTLSDVPEDKSWLADEFARSSSGANAMASIGYLLAVSAARDGIKKITVNKALANVERALNRHGQSLKALTHSEAYSLFDGLQSGYLSYAAFMRIGKNKPEDARVLKDLGL